MVVIFYTMNSEGAVIKGAVTGFALAAVSCLLIYMSGDQAEPFYTPGAFLAAAPFLLLLPPDLPDFLTWAIVFIYWISAGALTGRLIGTPERKAKIRGAVLILGIIFAHGLTLHKINEKIGEALAQGIDRISHL